VYPQDKDIWQWSGMISFTIGHIIFLAAVFTHLPQLNAALWLLVLISALIAIIAGSITTFGGPKMGLNYGQFKPICLIYATIGLFLIFFTIALAIFSGGLIRWVLMAIGSFVFIASDMILSQQYFGSAENIAKPSLVVSNHAAYYAAQFLIALSVMF
jgi:uncharacterized membrane protein YhhN